MTNFPIDSSCSIQSKSKLNARENKDLILYVFDFETF